VKKSFDFLKNHLIFLKIAHGPLFPVLHYLIPFSAIGCCHRNTVTCDSSVLVSYSGVTRSLLSLKVSLAHFENSSFSSLLLCPLDLGDVWSAVSIHSIFPLLSCSLCQLLSSGDSKLVARVLSSGSLVKP
jgi:hypothetical protein